jgi:hypothetical protein
LIEKVQKESKHKAIPYRLSIGGIYNLIHKQRFFVKLFKKVLQNYEDNIIFKTLLYPYLERNTIFQIYDTRLLSVVCGYLYDCCEATETALDSINNVAGEYNKEEVFIWKDVPAVDNARLLTFLKRRFNLNWLDKAEIKKFEDGNTIMIRYRAKSLSIMLNDKKTSAELKINRKKVYEFVVNPLPDGYLSIGAPGETVKATYTKFFEGMVSSLVSNLIVTLALGAIPGLGIGFEALAQDNRFMRLLEGTENKFRKQCDKLLAARKSIGVSRSKQKG